ncbi:MAG: NAD(P)-dependent oxidoreductase [Acidimicrobiales bacterium]|nr:NAD(P)-dependent oxidoreductase [Acidimicrobiales bacterium]
MTVVGVLHPGAMGTALAAELQTAGCQVRWASDGRGPTTRQRAAAAGLDDAGSLEALVAGSDVVLSVCPPGAAVEVAAAVGAAGFPGTYVDGNAVAPATARHIARVVGPARFVDGGIVGPPPHRPGTTRLHLSGDGAGEVAALFAGTSVETRVHDSGPGAASAVKVCFAAWTKGTSALLLAIRALAAAEGVEEGLLAEWATSLPDLPARSDGAAATAAPKAWRFVGEMEESAAAFAAAGLPGGFSEGAAEVYARLDGCRDADPPPTLDEVVSALLGRG